MNIYMTPDLQTANQSEGGITTVVRNYHKYLPSFGIKFVNDLVEADIYAVHAGTAGQFPSTVPVVSLCHGVHWSADYDAKLWEYETNRDVIQVLRYAKEIVVPSSWVAETFRRDLRVDPHVIGHGVDWVEWQHQEENLGYVVWAKNRMTDVCDPTPVNMLAKKFPKRLFLTTFAVADSTPNVKITGVLPYDEIKLAVQRSGVYLATTKETFGLGILEALAAGKPVLGFAYGGVLDLVEHGETGYLAKPGDYDDLATGLSYCFRHYKRLGEAARESAKRHTWAKVCEKLVNVFLEALYPEPSTVSVVIPIFNKVETLQRTVESVLAQEDPPDEIILVDNNSTDGSTDLGIQLALENHLAFLQEPKQGVAHARNRGVAYARSKYIVCLDSDDAIEPTFTQVCKAALEEDPSLGVAYTTLRWVDVDGNTDISEWPGVYDYNAFLQGQNQVPTGCMFRKEAWARVGGYRQRYAPWGAGAEDAEFFLRLGAYGWGGRKVTNEPLFVYSVGVGVTSQPGYQESKWRKWHPWVRDKQHPFASQAKPAKLSHPVRQYDSPAVSVIIPMSQNHQEFVIDALDSLEAQTFRYWEAIIVCDGFSTPPALQKAYPYVRWLEETKRGSGAARNVAADNARAPYLLFLDADDWLEPDALKVMLDTQKGGKSIVYTDYVGYSHVESEFAKQAEQENRLLFYNEGTKEAVIQYYSAAYDRARAIQQPDTETGRMYNWNLVTSLTPKSWHDAIGGFDEKMQSWEDWEYWIRMAKCNYPFTRMPVSLVNYRFYTGERREIGLANHEKLIAYMQDKFEEDDMCCGGSGGSVAQQYTPPPPLSINMGVMNNMNGNDYVMIELDDGKSGDHRIQGPITKTDYGYRVTGDRFLMHVKDVTSIVNSKGRLQVKILTLEEEPEVEIVEEDPPIEMFEGVPLITSMQGINSKTLALLEQYGMQTVKDVLNLGEEGLLPIKGIGPILAQRVVESAQKTLDAVSA